MKQHLIRAIGFGSYTALCTYTALCVLLFATPCIADSSFSWTDKATGRTVYGSKPPANASDVKKLNTKPLSRYSSDQVLRRMGWEERQAELQALEAKQKLAQDQPLPITAAPAVLKAAAPQLSLGEAGEVLNCAVEVTNDGDLPAAEVSIAFEFPDGTLVPGIGPSTIPPKSSESYSIPSELVPFFVRFEGDIQPDAEQLKPRVVVHGTQS